MEGKIYRAVTLYSLVRVLSFFTRVWTILNWRPRFVLTKISPLLPIMDRRFRVSVRRIGF